MLSVLHSSHAGLLREEMGYFHLRTWVFDSTPVLHCALSRYHGAMYKAQPSRACQSALYHLHSTTKSLPSWQGFKQRSACLAIHARPCRTIWLVHHDLAHLVRTTMAKSLQM